MSFSDHNHFHGRIVMLEFWIVLNEAFCRTENYFLVNFMNLVPIAVPGCSLFLNLEIIIQIPSFSNKLIFKQCAQVAVDVPGIKNPRYPGFGENPGNKNLKIFKNPQSPGIKNPGIKILRFEGIPNPRESKSPGCGFEIGDWGSSKIPSLSKLFLVQTNSSLKNNL